MIGEFVAARDRDSDRPVLMIGIDIANGLACVSDEGGLLSIRSIEAISIDWHYDGAQGKWMPDFEEG